MTPDWCRSSSGAASSVHRLVTQRQWLDGERPHLEVCTWDPGPGASIDDIGPLGAAGPADGPGGSPAALHGLNALVLLVVPVGRSVHTARPAWV